MKMAVFWVLALCSVVEVYQHFRGAPLTGDYPDDGSNKHL
jgi:hypothetical protein